MKMDVFFKTTWNILANSFRNTLSRWFDIGLCRNYPSFYELTFYHDGEKCSLRFPKVRGVRDIVAAYSGKEDVTKQIYEHLGPCHNFYGIPTTPELLGYSSLSIQYRNKTFITYSAEEVIQTSSPQDHSSSSSQFET